MSSGRKTTDRLFDFVCIGFSLLMLLAGLICRVGILNSEARVENLEKSIALAQSKTELLSVMLESRLSLEQLEKEAVNRLGMQHPAPEQIFYMG